MGRKLNQTLSRRRRSSGIGSRPVQRSLFPPLTRVAVEGRGAAVEVRGEAPLQRALAPAVQLADAVRHTEAHAVEVEEAARGVKGPERVAGVDAGVRLAGLGLRGQGEGGGPELRDGAKEPGALGELMAACVCI